MSVSLYKTISAEHALLCELEQGSSGNPAFMQSMAVWIDGSLDVDVLGRSVNEVVRRHAALRTTFPTVAGRVKRRVDASLHPALKILDRAAIAVSERQREILRQAAEEVLTPFDLARGPLVRSTLVRFSPDAHALILTAHDTIFDEDSAEIFLREVAAIYASFSAGEPLPLAEPSLSTDDFVRPPPSVDFGGDLAYWRKQLAGELPVLELTTDRPRPAVRSLHGAAAEREIPAAIVEGLEELGRREGVKVFVILLSAFATLLHRYTERGDILIGTPYSPRTHARDRGVIGRLGYPLVVRTRLEDELSFQRLLQQVAADVAGAEAHGGVPFGVLLKELRPPEDPSRHPLFQAAFELREAAPAAPVALPGVTFVRLPLERAVAEVDLSLSVRPAARGLSATLVYSTDLFDAETAERMLAHLHILLGGIVGDPERSIAELPLMTAAERYQILVEWNDTQTDYPRDACIHELFEAQVDKTPEAVAAVYEGQEITYRELNRRANRLAHSLRARGVGPDVPVGIFMERSLEMLIGLLGILKAGGAYVPLDPKYPDERLRVMLGDTAAPVLLGGRRQMARLDFQGEVVILDEDTGPADGQAETNPASGATATHLAYVMFTSGSTGQPKGAAVPHRGVIRLVLRTNYVEFGPSDRVMHASSVAFDASTFEIWGALLNGACLILVPQETLLSPKAFSALVHRERITVMFLTTALFHQMASLNPKAFNGLSSLVVGGDALDPGWAREVLEKGAPKRLVNGYGPTENTTFSTFHLVDEVRQGASSVAIGRPISNSRAYVLNHNLRAVPVGIAGELYVAGDGLARGYIGRPDLTAERFVKNPLDEEPGAHLYKTGDRVRFLRDGTIEFLGRIDSQVKIRGFRVELGEIESVLAACPTVLDAAVMVREDTPGDKRLVAYVVSSLVSDRVPLYSMCRVELDGGDTVDVMTKDVSSVGLGLLGVPETWKTGQSVRLYLRLPGIPEQQRILGIVAWCTEGQAGIQLELTPAEQALLQASVNHILETQDLIRVLERAVSCNLRNFVKDKLPEYMVPAHFVMMRSLPLTPNGKVDRRALPPPGREKLGVERPLFTGSPVEEQVARIWAEVLNVDRVEVRDDFFERSGNSLLAAQMLIRVQETFQVDLSVGRLFESPTVASLALAVEEARRDGASAAAPNAMVDLRAEAVLDADVRPAEAYLDEGKQPRHVFLTGATGFLGAFLLHELLRETKARIHCLVRAKSSLDGLARIQKTLEDYSLWDPSMSARIVPIPGDLSQPLLGLPIGNFEMLSEQIDVIYHSGAEISYVKPYSSHKAANVLGTQEVLRLSCLGRVKPLHYISTIAVFGNVGYFTGVDAVKEGDDLDPYVDYLQTDMGYAQSKWVAEKLVWIARSRGAPVSVFRPGFIMGHSKTGACNLNDFACRMIKGCIQIGYYPDLPAQSKEFVPVDFVSRAIVHLSRRRGSLGKAFHLVPAPPQRIDLLGFFELIRSYGYSLEKLEYGKWRDELLKQLKRSPDNPLLPLVPMLTERVHEGSRTRWEMYEKMPVYDCQNTLDGLLGTTLVCPPMDAGLLDTYLSHYIQRGFLWSPRAGRTKGAYPSRAA